MNIGISLMWDTAGWNEYIYWQETDSKIILRINDLIRDMLRHPFEGIGKPEPLRNQLKGYWSRRITQEHRLVYKVEGPSDRKILIIVQCKSHY